MLSRKNKRLQGITLGYSNVLPWNLHNTTVIEYDLQYYSRSLFFVGAIGHLVRQVVVLLPLSFQ